MLFTAIAVDSKVMEAMKPSKLRFQITNYIRLVFLEINSDMIDKFVAYYTIDEI